MRESDPIEFVQLKGSPQPAGITAQSVAIPSLSIDDPRFKYTPACKTDLAETFRKARESMK